MICENFGIAGAVAVGGDDFLCGGGEEEGEVGLGGGLGAVFCDAGIDPGDAGFGADAGGGVDDFEVVGGFADFADGFVFPSELDVALAGEDEGGGGVEGVLAEGLDVAVEFFDEGAGVGLGAAAVNDGAPGGEEAELTVGRNAGVGGDDGNAWADEIGPILDLAGVGFADDEDDGGGVGMGVVGQAGAPAWGDEAVLGDGVDVGGKREGNDVGGEAVNDGFSLRGGGAVGLADLERLAGLFFVGGDEGGVDLAVELAGGVVGSVGELEGIAGLAVAKEEERGGGEDEEDGKRGEKGVGGGSAVHEHDFGLLRAAGCQAL